jgi:putative nucleotidyltransferase with HDIG domain
MIERKISMCGEGDILASDVLNSCGVTLVAKDTILNEYIIEQLMMHGIKSINIYQTQKYSNNDSSTYAKFKSNYINTITQTKILFQDLISGKPIDYQSVLSIADQIYINIDENDKIFRCLTNIRNSDEYTYTHSVNVAFYSMQIAKWLKLSDHEIKKVIQSGLLHDVGKSKIPNKILNKKGILTKEEYEVIKRHTILGHEIVKNVDEIDVDVRNAVLLHHERADGSGYPYRCNSKQMTIYSKIVAVADVFDAMTSDRVYKKGSTPFKAIEMFQIVGMSLFDTKIISVFLNNLAAYLVGSNVILSNGESGEIVFIPLQSLTCPIIKTSSGYLDLSNENTLNILNMI